MEKKSKMPEKEYLVLVSITKKRKKTKEKKEESIHLFDYIREWNFRKGKVYYFIKKLISSLISLA